MSDEHLAGYTADEIRTDEPTRSSRLKWVVIVDESLPPGRAVNAAACVASATGATITGLLGPDAVDAAGSTHPGLPWAGCTVLGASPERLRAVRAKAVAELGTHLVDMPTYAQTTRVYDDYIAEIGGSDDSSLDYYALSIIGPRKRIDKLVKGLSLLP